MAELSCLEITNTRKILSISTPEPDFLYQLLPSDTKNLLQCWDEETNKQLKDNIELVFDSAFPIDFCLTINNNKLQFLGHRLSETKAVIYIKPEKNNYPILDGNTKPLYDTVIDITEKKIMEERLHLVDFAFKKTAVSIFITKEDASLYEFNNAALDLYGYTQEEMEKLTVADLTVAVEREDVPQAWANLWSKMKEHKTIAFNSKHQKKDGTIIDVEIRVNYILYNGIELNCAFVLDITDTKKTEEALRKSIERYEYATNAASDVIWEADFIENTYFLSQNYTTYFGHPSGVYQELYQNEWIRNIHPDDIERVMQTSSLAIKSDENKWISEYRLKKADGEYAIVVDKGFVLKDKKGKALKLIGSLNDISLKKEAERERENLIKECWNYFYHNIQSIRKCHT